MINGTTFYTSEAALDYGFYTHSAETLNLIQQKVVISPAEPKVDFLDIPGSDGSLDKSEIYGRIYYKDRTITWTFAVRPEDDWYSKQTQVSNALNGQRLYIRLDEDMDHYYYGRIRVTNYNRDRMLMQITVVATVAPWRYLYGITEVVETLTTTEKYVELTNRVRPVVPDILINQDTILGFRDSATSTWKTVTYTVETPGLFEKIPTTSLLEEGFEIGRELYPITARTAAAVSGDIQINYIKADL